MAKKKKLNAEQQERLDNAIKIAEEIQAYLRLGYLVLDGVGDVIKNFVVEKDEDGYTRIGIRHNKYCYYEYMWANPEYDNGLELTPKEYREKFKDWKFIRPEHIETPFAKE